MSVFYDLDNGRTYSRENLPAACLRCGDPWCIQCWECDCPIDPHHRWNCPLTPIWAQTMRELDVNPWTVVTESRAYSDLSLPPVGINVWSGLPGTHCGRGPCCLSDGHNGRCRT